MSDCNLPEDDEMPEPLHWFDVMLEGADELMLVLCYNEWLQLPEVDKIPESLREVEVMPGDAGKLNVCKHIGCAT